MGSQTILVLEDDPDRYQNIEFLLQLSGYHSIRTLDETEALNWIARRHGSPASIALLLANGRFSAGALMMAEEELSRLEIPVPFLVVEPAAPGITAASFWGRQQLPRRFFFCMREELLPMIQALLTECRAETVMNHPEETAG